MGKENKTSDVSLHDLKLWVPERIKFFNDERTALLNNPNIDLAECVIKLENIEGKLEALEEISLMLEGKYNCENCIGNSASCKDNKERKICSLFTFSGCAI